MRVIWQQAWVHMLIIVSQTQWKTLPHPGLMSSDHFVPPPWPVSGPACCSLISDSVRRIKHQNSFKSNREMIPHLFFLLLPLCVFSQSDFYQAKPWVPKNISPGVAEFISRPGPKTGRSYPAPPAPVYSSQHNVPAYVQNSGYIQHLKDQQMSGSNGKPIRVASPPVTSRNFATQVYFHTHKYLQKWFLLV